MGFIRSGLVFFIGILLFLSLLAGNIVLTINLSLDYNHVKTYILSTIKEDVRGQFNQEFTDIQTSCQSNSRYTLNIDKSQQINIPCSIITEGEDSSLDYILEKIVEENYYKEYNCGFFNCPITNGFPVVYLSQHAKDYWRQKFYLSLTLSLILILLMFFLIENKKGLFIDVGGFMIISSLPLLAMGGVASKFDFVDILFSKAKSVFLAVFILGIVLITIGIVLKFWRFDREEKIPISEVKDMVKKEVSKINKDTASKIKKK